LDYVLEQAGNFDWRVIVGDVSISAGKERVGNFQYGTAIAFDIQQESSSEIIKVVRL